MCASWPPRTCAGLQPPCFTFGFVRDPYARLVSCYRHKIERPRQQGKRMSPIFWVYGRAFSLQMGFPEFVRAVAAVPDERAEKHFRSQTRFLYRDGRPIVDFVGRLENFESGLGRGLPAHPPAARRSGVQRDGRSGPPGGLVRRHPPRPGQPALRRRLRPARLPGPTAGSVGVSPGPRPASSPVLRPAPLHSGRRSTEVGCAGSSGFLGLALAAAAVVDLLRRLVAYEIADHSMSPTLQPGDRVLGLRGLAGPPRRRGRVRPSPAARLRDGEAGGRRPRRGHGPGGAGPGRDVGPGRQPRRRQVDSRALGPIRAEWLGRRLFLRYHPAPVAPIR